MEPPKAVPQGTSTMLRMPDLASFPKAPSMRTIGIGDKEGNPTGMNVKYCISGEEAFIVKVAIPREYAGRGFAQWLVEQAFTALRAMGIKTVSTDPRWKALNKKSATIWARLKDGGYPITMDTASCSCDLTKITPESIRESLPSAAQEYPKH
jgi:predicted GNAT family acetyltransferase